MRKTAYLIPGIALLAIALTLAGCSSKPKGSNVLGPEVGGTMNESAAGRELELGRSRVPGIDPEDFVRRVDHAYFPLVPGTVYRYKAETDEGTETVVVRVKRDTRRIVGVTNAVVSDKVFLDGELKEDTIDWYAQDEDGNVWYFGEDTKEYEGGKVVSTEGTWLAGKLGAIPGFIMLARPQVGRSYKQEVAPGVAEDEAKIVSLNETVTVPYGRFRNCIQTLETTPLDPTSIEYKYYARGVGHILTVRLPDGLRTELTSVRRGDSGRDD